MRNQTIREKIVTAALWLSALIIVGILISIIAYLSLKGISAVTSDFILQAPSHAGAEGEYQRLLSARSI
jgi:ABC-type phosphate transport system permease subunit